MEEPTPSPAGSTTQAKNSSPGKDLLFVGCLVVLLIGVFVGVVCVLLKFALPALKGKPAQAVTAAPVEVPPPPAPDTPVPPAPEKKPAPRPPVERKVPAAKPAGPKAGPVSQNVNLGADPKEARELVDIAASGTDITHISLTLSNARADGTLHIPMGTVFVPVETTNMCPFVVFAARTVTVTKDAPASAQVEAVGTDFRYFLSPVASVRFEPADKPADSLLTRFLAYCAGHTSAWNIVQAGTWVLESNISKEDLEGFQLSYPDAAAPGGTRSAPVVSYAEIKKVEGIVSALGANPDSYKLFVQERNERQRLLTQVDFDKPAPDCGEILRSKVLARYSGDSEVENVLRQYLTRHKRFSVRRAALENLIELGSRSTPDMLVQRATYGDHYFRFLAAFELFKLGDERAYPLLAVHGEDPMFEDLCAKPLADAILKKTGAEKKADETLFDYWKRTLGWTSLPGQPYATERIRTAVEQYLPKVGASDPQLTQLLQQITLDDDRAVSQACSQLRAFPRNCVAYEALCRTAANHRSADVRRNALYSLTAFIDFDPREACKAALKNDEQEIRAAVNLACAVQFEGLEDFFKLVAQNKSPDVRRDLAQTLGNTGLPEAEAPLILLARSDSDQSVRSAAIMALSSMKSPESIKFCVKLLSGSDPEEKRNAFRYLQQWRDDPRALDILERHRSDPDIGEWVSEHLRYYGRGQ